MECTQERDIIYLQQNMYFPNGVKPHGVIIKKSDFSSPKQETQTATVDNPLANLATITSNNSSYKMPGEIKTMFKETPPQVDQLVHYNADVYNSGEKYRQKIEYESVEHLAIPIKQRSKSLNTNTAKNVILSRPLESIEEQGAKKMANIHGEFELERYKQLSPLLRNMKMTYNDNEVQFLSNIKRYIQLVSTSKIAQIRHIKMAENKREIIRQCFIAERQAVVAICLTIIAKKQEKYKNYCSNLLKYVYDNYLVVFNLLTHESNPFVLKLIGDEGGYLLGKGFQLLRNNREVICDLINKIVKLDPLFTAQYYKIVQSSAGREADFIFNALLTFFAFYVHALKVQHIIPFMSCAAGPFLVEKATHQYTLVIDFMRVFMNDSKTSKKQRKSRDAVSVRPYSTYFVKEMSKYFEIVSYSNSMPVECNSIINAIDEGGVVKNRLYRYHFSQGKREMAKISRNVDRMILIDTVEDEQNKNLLLVSNWKGESSNVQLAEVCPLLALIVVKKLSAIAALQKIRETVKSNSGLGLKYINCGLDL